MALYDAIEIPPSGDTEDYSYEGVTVLRNGMGNVTRMYVKQGYAGSKTVYGLWDRWRKRNVGCRRSGTAGYGYFVL